MTTATAVITADEHHGLYQFFVNGEPTGIEADIITAGSDSQDIAMICAQWIESRYGCTVGEVTHDKDTVFVECVQ